MMFELTFKKSSSRTEPEYFAALSHSVWELTRAIFNQSFIMISQDLSRTTSKRLEEQAEMVI